MVLQEEAKYASDERKAERAGRVKAEVRSGQHWAVTVGSGQHWAVNPKP
jgi:hypothetical protein